MKWIKWIDLRVYQLISLINVLIGICLVLVTFWQVLSRYILYIPSPWTIELDQHLFVWFCLLGAALNYKDNEHFKIDYFFNLFPKKIKILLGIFFNIILFILFIALIYYGYIHVLSVSYRTSPILHLNRCWLFMPVVIAGIIMLFFQIVYILGPYRSKKGQSNITDL